MNDSTLLNNKTQKNCVQDRSQMLLKLEVNSQNFQNTQFSKFYKHDQTCQNSMIRFDAILKTCPDLLKFYDTI